MKLIRIISIILILAGFTHCYAQTEWELSKEKNGIKVFTKKADSSSFKYIKVVCTLDGSWKKLAAILMDIKLQPQWVYHSKQTYPIKKVNDNEVVYYSVTSLPWPVNDRDAVVRMKLFLDRSTNVYKVLSTNEPKGLPAKKGLVRVPEYKATWDVKEEAKNRIDITYVLEVLPGGTLPAWVVNMFVTKGPFETFNKLAALLKQ